MQVKISDGSFALVDDADYERVMRHKWYPHKGYAWNSTTGAMHRFVKGVKKGDPILVDHRDLDKRNNQKDNLRKANRVQNGGNQRKRKRAARGECTSRFKGVWAVVCKGKIAWKARCQGEHCPGTFSTEEEAARAYDTAARRIYKEFARTNF